MLDCRALGALLLGGVLTGCAGRQRLAPARPACPAARVSTHGWPLVTDSAGVSYRLPAAFAERATGAAFREWLLEGDFQQSIAVGFMPSSSPASSLGRTASPGMLEMTQCVDSVGSREVLVQAWRTRGGVFRDGRHRDRYDVFAVVPVRADLRLYLASGGYERRTQELALAVVRTIAVAAGSPPN